MITVIVKHGSDVKIPFLITDETGAPIATASITAWTFKIRDGLYEGSAVMFTASSPTNPAVTTDASTLYVQISAGDGAAHNWSTIPSGEYVMGWKVTTAAGVYMSDDMTLKVERGAAE